VEAGARIFVRSHVNEFRNESPLIVEAVAAKWDAITYPRAERTVEAKDLKAWLRQAYPPGFNEHLYPWESVSGTLTLKPAGSKEGVRYAILRGRVRLSTEEGGGHAMDATVEAVVTYGADTEEVRSLRAVVEGDYPRRDAYRGSVTFRVEATVESRPD
jgi:hypothetical protein